MLFCIEDCSGIFRTLSNIEDGAFCENYFLNELYLRCLTEELHLRCLTAIRIPLWTVNGAESSLKLVQLLSCYASLADFFNKFQTESIANFSINIRENIHTLT